MDLPKVKICVLFALLAVAVLAFGADAYTSYKNAAEAGPAIGSVIKTWTTNNTLTTWAVGVLCGHFFWSGK